MLLLCSQLQWFKATLLTTDQAFISQIYFLPLVFQTVRQLMLAVVDHKSSYPPCQKDSGLLQCCPRRGNPLPCRQVLIIKLLYHSDSLKEMRLLCNKPRRQFLVSPSQCFWLHACLFGEMMILDAGTMSSTQPDGVDTTFKGRQASTNLVQSAWSPG